MSGFSLKLIALVAMFMDHAGEFFPELTPIAFRWIGRISAPLFFFMMTQAMAHTRSRRRYFFRLYAGSVVMAVGNYALTVLFPQAPVPVTNNIFATLLLSALSIHLIELFQCEEKQATRYMITFAVYNVAAFVLMQLALRFLSHTEALLVSGLVPNLLSVEGGIFFVGIGVALYFWKDDRWKMSCFYLTFALMELFAAVSQDGFAGAFTVRYQWMMIFALPLMLYYNGEKGHSAKKFFYIFYPAHIWALFLISVMM